MKKRFDSGGSYRDPSNLNRKASKLRRGMFEAAKFAQSTSQENSSFDKVSFIEADVLNQFQSFATEIFTVKPVSAKKLTSEVLSARVSPTDTHVVWGLSDGAISLTNVSQPKKSESVSVSADVPITALEWQSRQRFYAGTSKGDLRLYSLGTERDAVAQLSDKSFDGEQILTMHSSEQLGKLLVAGTARTISVVNAQTGQVESCYKSGSSFEAGHTNRIFCVRFAAPDSPVLASGGWDGIVYMWDLRQAAPAATIFGPTLSGESLDVKDNVLLAGSYREKDNLELFDLRTYAKLVDVPFKSLKGSSVNYISSCQFNKEGPQMIIAGSCMGDQLIIFRKNIVYQPELGVNGVGKGVYVCGFGNTRNLFYAGTRDGDTFLNVLQN